jgi:hypothetical protein
MSELFSNDALSAELRKLPDLPPEEVNVGAVATGGDVGVEANVNKTLSKGWFIEGQGSWMARAGASAALWLGWKGTS